MVAMSCGIMMRRDLASQIAKSTPVHYRNAKGATRPAGRRPRHLSRVDGSA
jgi:hypothetical protein